ncbi:MAG: hypothetical protein RIF32_02315 [Leptospirales bacterium]
MADFVPYPGVSFPRWLVDEVSKEVDRLGPDFNLARYGRQALRYGLQNPGRLPEVSSPYNGRVIHFMRPARLLKLSQ